MRKLIRYSALAFLVWAVTTFAWAALSHATGFVGPAEASGTSLRFVASAVTFVDPPGVLGAPQRLAASQIRHAARAVERIHRGPERAMGRVLDRLGHDAHHRGHRHRVRHAVRIERDGRSLEIPLDELDGARERAMARARIELERHRRGLERERRDLERGRSSLDRERWRRAVEVRRQEHLQRRVELVRERLQGAEVGQDGDRKRKLMERLREILRELERELENVQVEQRVDIDVEATEDIASRILESLEIELQAIGEEISGEAPVRIRIRGNGN